MKHFHENPRIITGRQMDQLREWLAELGDLGGIVHDLNTDEVIGGNQRVEALGILGAEPIIEQRFDPPTAQGTVALGYYEVHGERFGYRAVRWTLEQCAKANIVANKAGGTWDWEELATWDAGELVEWGFSEEELQQLDYENPKLREKSQQLKPREMFRVLVSVPVDSALDVRTLCEQIEAINGAEVLYGAN